MEGSSINSMSGVIECDDYNTVTLDKLKEIDRVVNKIQRGSLTDIKKIM